MPVVVPFGGAEHDWAALELGSWLAAASGAPLKLLGAAGQTDEGKSVTRMLADAGLLVQQATGIATEPLVVAGGRDGIVEAATGAGLAGGRTLGALAARGSRHDAVGDRERGAVAGAVRQAGHPSRAVRAQGERHAVPVVDGRRPVGPARIHARAVRRNDDGERSRLARRAADLGLLTCA